jgi:hypothetical protein
MDKVKVSELLEAKRDPRFACWGCTHYTGWTAAGGFECPKYIDPQKLYAIRVFGICPHNKPKVKEKKKFVRVGQQKQRRF